MAQVTGTFSWVMFCFGGHTQQQLGTILAQGLEPLHIAPDTTRDSLPEAGVLRLLFWESTGQCDLLPGACIQFSVTPPVSWHLCPPFSGTLFCGSSFPMALPVPWPSEILPSSCTIPPPFPEELSEQKRGLVQNISLLLFWCLSHTRQCSGLTLHLGNPPKGAWGLGVLFGVLGIQPRSAVCQA